MRRIGSVQIVGLLVACQLIAGCAATKQFFLGTDTPTLPQTTRQWVIAVDAGIQFASEETGALLVAGIIKTEDAVIVHTILKNAYSLNDRARTQFLVGKELDASDLVQQANTLLQNAISELDKAAARVAAEKAAQPGGGE